MPKIPSSKLTPSQMAKRWWRLKSPAEKRRHSRLLGIYSAIARGAKLTPESAEFARKNGIRLRPSQIQAA